MNALTQIISCPNCGAKNRVSLENKGVPICAKCKQTLSFPASPLTITDENFNESVEKSGLPVLLDFWATWCPPCKLIAPTIDALAKDLAGRAIIGKLDVDKNPLVASRFRVQSIPTLIIFKDGREAERLVGAQSKEAILQKLNRFL